ncbi:MAG: AAA family ATPase, partial [Gammaproteobacteria bacterium]|nr:AAA family ATPase [Gammaproteobacteria bacterium]
TAYWRSCLGTPRYHGWLGYAFENICYKHLTEIRRKLGIKGFAPASSWRFAGSGRGAEAGAQIDLLFDRDDDAITLCEIKFTERPFSIDKRCAQALLRKKETFIKGTKTRKQVFLAFIAAHGVEETLYADELIDGVVTLGDLF